MKARTILVGIDGSAAATEAAREAASMARGLGCALELVAAYRPVLFASPASPELVERLISEEEKACAPLLEAVAKDPALAGLEVRRHAEMGEPAEVLVTLAERDDVAMLVVGSRGRNAAARLLLGSVSDRVVHLSPKPVLVVR